MVEELLGPTGEQTEYLLKSISERLSGREDCKRTEYIVTINDNGVNMSPLIQVFPNRYKRKEGDKIDIVSFVHQYKMSNARLDGFVFGTYKYQLTPDRKQRKWRKINES